MRTARFSKVVATSGKPEVYLAFTEPATDRVLQAAVKANRVMTVVQHLKGTSADQGIVGFESGKNRQFLIFPKSLRAFAGRTVVGIKYDLLDSHELPKKDRAVPPRPPKPKPKPKRPPAPRKKAGRSELSRIIPFESLAKVEDSEEVSDLKQQIRRAMALLEDGKAVAAFNLLKRVAGD